MVNTSTTWPNGQTDLREVRNHHAWLIRSAEHPPVRPFVFTLLTTSLLTPSHGSALAGVLSTVPDLRDEIEGLREALACSDLTTTT